MEIVFLGTAGSVARKDRDNTSLLIKEKGSYLLVDVPGAVVQKLRKLSIDYFQINNIFITHIHPDHIYGLPSFIHARMFDAQSTINIYGHKKSVEFVQKLLTLFNLKRNKFPKIKFYRLHSKSHFSVSDSFYINTFKTRHSAESLGLKIEYKNKTIIYTSDTAYSQNVIKTATGADYLIHDCFAPTRFFRTYPLLEKMHTSTHAVAEVYKKSKVKTLIPIHFSGEFNFKISEISTEFRKLGVKNFILPKDLQILKINYR
ncbi:MAG: hypothetical protein B6D53_02070 [Candidatus Omnitrophica bacterium 4484_49]|nr:ribonuclease Z [Candidatus Omnitrophota bacterium]OQX83590.1 MAG: hypothetical protein B6D53_02070 [Candidatus Omnitrophica bacterium 4484_49]